MANKFWKPIHHAIVPDGNGNTYWELAGTNFKASPRYNIPVLAFTSQSAKQGGSGMFEVPENYVGTPKIQIVFATTVTSGNAQWEFDYSSIADAASLDPGADAEAANTGNNAVSGSTRFRQTKTITLTGANFHVEDVVIFNFYRDATQTSPAAATLWLFGLFFEYLDA